MKRWDIKAVIFDVGGVLSLVKGPDKEVGHHPVRFSKYISKKLGIDLGTWKRVVGKYHINATTGRDTKSIILKKLSRDFGVENRRLEMLLVKTFKRTFKRNRDLYRFAFKLKKKGYKIAILSDQWSLSKDCCMKKKDIDKFNTSVVSCDVKTKKPSLKIYKIVLKRLRLKSRECVFIDNKSKNVTAARKIGMQGILFKSNKQVKMDLKKIGVST